MKRSSGMVVVLSSDEMGEAEAAQLVAADAHLPQALLDYLRGGPESAIEAARAIRFFGLRRRGVTAEMFRDAMLLGLAADDARVVEQAARITAVSLLLDSRPPPGGMASAVQSDLRNALARALESHALPDDTAELAQRACKAPG